MVKRSWRESGVAFALPWMVGMVTLTLVPMAVSLTLSFARWDGLGFDSIGWVGSAHYERLWPWSGGESVDPRAVRALTNTVAYSLFAVSLNLMAAMVLALLLNRRLRGMVVFRTVFFLPYLLSSVATVMMWSWLFNPRFGLVNRGLRVVCDFLAMWPGLDGFATIELPGWLYSEAGCMPTLVLMHVWLCGGPMLVFLAALQRVPMSLYEAAALDGAGRWRRFWHVTMPQLSPAVLFNLVIGLIFAMQTFDRAYLLYNRSQNDGLLFYMLYLYRIAFETPFRIGFASAMAWVLFVVIAVMVVPVLIVGRRVVFYAVRR